MTASERLRELDGALTPGLWEASDVDGKVWIAGIADVWERQNLAVIPLRNALSLIIDVVEAAEKMAAWWPNEVHGEITGEQFQPLRDALTALREALEGSDGS